jgi:two-component sensor histidine kinase
LSLLACQCKAHRQTAIAGVSPGFADKNIAISEDRPAVEVKLMLATPDKRAEASDFSINAGAEIASSETNHRIINSLTMLASLVSMQARSIGGRPGSMSNRDVECLLSELRFRIEAVASLHRQLSVAPKAPSVMLLSDHLASICGSLVSSLTKSGNVALSFDLDRECVIERDKFLMLTWIVSELVTNAIKYAHPAGVPGHIRVVLRRTPRELVLEVIDDGVGLPKDFDPSADGGFGLQLVHTLAKGLSGRISFADAGVGLKCQFRMPVGELANCR